MAALQGRAELSILGHEALVRLKRLMVTSLGRAYRQTICKSNRKLVTKKSLWKKLKDNYSTSISSPCGYEAHQLNSWYESRLKREESLGLAEGGKAQIRNTTKKGCIIVD